MSQVTLYKIYSNRSNELLYVGISSDPTKRCIDEHRKGKYWADEIGPIIFEHFPTREEAKKAETIAIKTESPRYNIAEQNPDAVVVKERNLNMIKTRLNKLEAERFSSLIDMLEAEVGKELGTSKVIKLATLISLEASPAAVKRAVERINL